MLVYFDRDSQTVFAEDGTKLLLDQICLSGSCFGDSETIISVQTKITRITELLPYQVQQICANEFARLDLIEKKLCTIFSKNGLRITIEVNNVYIYV